jgi:lysozyme
MIPRFRDLSPIRQEVLVEMVYQLGLTGVLGFRRMLDALRQSDYRLASVEMLRSRWAEQTPNRASELALRMRDNE